MIVGIDLGTTFSAIAYMDDNNTPQIIPNLDGGRTTPSVVMFDGDEICVGEQAKLNSITDPYNVCQLVKRQMGDKNFKFESEDGKIFTAEDISALILKSLKTTAEQTLAKNIEGAVITVPAYFDDAQRKATKDAGQIAGLNVLSVINEPTAAAIAYCHNGKKDSQKVMVFDLGGGTFDITIIDIKSDTNIEILATNGHKNLGGFDFDNEIIKIVVDEFEEKHDIDLYDDDVAMQDLRGRAETAKKTLSTRSKATIAVMSQGKTVKMDITQDDFNSRIKGILNNVKTIMEIAMDDSELEWGDLDKIILVGGSTRVLAIQNMIKDVTGITPSHDVNPDEAVALGAACYAQSLGNTSPQCKKIKVSDVNSHSLGIVMNDDDGNEYNQIIIPRNTKIPVEIERVAYTSIENQTGLTIQVTEGEDEELDYVTILGEALITLSPTPLGSPIKIIMSYDKNGMVQVCVLDNDTDEKLGDITLERKSNLSDFEIQEKIDRMSDLMENDDE